MIIIYALFVRSLDGTLQEIFEKKNWRVSYSLCFFINLNSRILFHSFYSLSFYRLYPYRCTHALIPYFIQHDKKHAHKIKMWYPFHRYECSMSFYYHILYLYVCTHTQTFWFIFLNEYIMCLSHKRLWKIVVEILIFTTFRLEYRIKYRKRATELWFKELSDNLYDNQICMCLCMDSISFFQFQLFDVIGATVTIVGVAVFFMIVRYIQGKYIPYTHFYIYAARCVCINVEIKCVYISSPHCCRMYRYLWINFVAINSLCATIQYIVNTHIYIYLKV